MLAASSPLPRDLVFFALSVAFSALANLLTPMESAHTVVQPFPVDDTRPVAVTVQNRWFPWSP